MATISKRLGASIQQKQVPDCTPTGGWICRVYERSRVDRFCVLVFGGNPSRVKIFLVNQSAVHEEREFIISISRKFINGHLGGEPVKIVCQRIRQKSIHR